jgi:hypothetical protein
VNGEVERPAGSIPDSFLGAISMLLFEGILMEEWLDELNEYARLGSMRAFEHIAKELRSKGYKCIQRVEISGRKYSVSPATN